MIKEFKRIINEFFNDNQTPMLIKEAIALEVVLFITILLALFITNPEIMFGITGFYLMARIFLEILRRH